MNKVNKNLFGDTKYFLETFSKDNCFLKFIKGINNLQSLFCATRQQQQITVTLRYGSSEDYLTKKIVENNPIMCKSQSTSEGDCDSS